MDTTSSVTSIQTLDITVSEVYMITLEQTRMYEKMNVSQLEDLYTSTVRTIRKTDDVESQINLGSKLNYLRSIIMEKKMRDIL